MPRLEHVGIAVQEAAPVADLLEKLLNLSIYKTETVSEQKVRTTFLSDETAKLELLESLEETSTLARFLDRRGEGLHHLAFEVEDIFETLEAVQQLGLEPLSKRPQPGADGKQIFFLHPRQTHGILIEFCQDTTPPLNPVPLFFEGGELATYRRGNPQAPPIVLLHGALGTTELDTYALLKELERSHYVLAVDFPGHGSSDDIPSLPLTLDGVSRSVTALLDDAGVDQTTVFGFSFGAAVALALASRTPNRVQRVVAHAANPFWPVQETEQFFDADRIQREQPEWAQQLDVVHGSQQWKRLCSRIVKGARQVEEYLLPEQRLAAISQPALITVGDRDPLAPLKQTVRLHEHLPASELSVLPGLNHSFQQVDASLYARLIRSFTNRT